MTPEGEGILLPVKDGGGKAVRTWRADAALAGNTLIWGSTFVLVQAALKDVSPILFLAIRFSIATARSDAAVSRPCEPPAHPRRA